MRRLVPALLSLMVLFLGFVPLQEREQELSIKIISPPARSFPTGRVEIAAEVSSPKSPVKQVEFYVDDRLIANVKQPPYRCRWDAGAAATRHVIEVLVFDTEGNFARDVLILGEREVSFEVEVDLVPVYVTITDREEKLVPNLEQGDFILTEDDIPQVISHFSRENVPLSMVILIDISSSMIGARMSRAQQAAVDMVERMITGENRATVIGFDDRVYLFQDFTDSPPLLKSAINSMEADGGTALYDAIAHTVRKLRNMSGKKAIILLSDGDDTHSQLIFDDVLDYSAHSDILVYAVGLQRLTFSQTFIKDTNVTINQLDRISSITGGRAYFPSFIDHLPQIYRQISRELQSQYSLAYRSTNRKKDSTWRTIQVRIRNRPDLIVRTRKGYYARQR
ncbi:MAG: VWA domain-containing protein [Candidatus Aminicenantes bacterium]|nr:VWA domain-containing protein [Candidatus Aminicenantes bacterium]